jgi:hypothetical protein
VESGEAPAVAPRAPDAAQPTPGAARLAGAIAVLAWLGCLGVAVWVATAEPDLYTGRLEFSEGVLLGLSVVYFVAAAVWISRRRSVEAAA